MMRPEYSRRSILRRGLCAAAVGLTGLPGFGAESPNERILVCVYLLGGNDGNNMVVPLDDYGNYVGARGDLTITAADLLAAAGSGTGRIAFHPAMGQVRDLYDSGELAVIANTGWAARAGSHTNNPDFSYFAGGYIASRWAATAVGAQSLQPNGNVITGFPSVSKYAAPQDASAVTLSGRGAAAQKDRLVAAAANEDLRFATAFPQSAIGLQLLQVARMIRSGLGGMMSAHFSTVQEGYDTHTDQLRQQGSRLAELSEAIAAFYNATAEIGVSRNVTLYTDSDFGRALVPNTTGGSEHGWGNHQLVLGGSVIGGNVYGSFPSLALGGASDAGRNGVWVPTLNKAQYLASLGAWAGITPAALRGASEEFRTLSPAALNFLR